MVLGVATEFISKPWRPRTASRSDCFAASPNVLPPIYSVAIEPLNATPAASALAPSSPMRLLLSHSVANEPLTRTASASAGAVAGLQAQLQLDAAALELLLLDALRLDRRLHHALVPLGRARCGSTGGGASSVPEVTRRSMSPVPCIAATAWASSRFSTRAKLPPRRSRS